ncbi:MAG TPA: peptidyl-prolyl cis-trans isomerase [Solirubrobacterales bacterium]|nr:peptidyl-prolyl cis-trans isomerase [Solirubrobacterales bacterium]
MGLLIFGVAFVVLFLIVAIADGIGDPSVPSGDVALVEGTPGDVGEVTQAKFEHAVELAAAQGGENTPKPGDPKYEELKETALNSLFESIRIQGLASEWGIVVTEEEIAKELKKVKKETFKTKAEFDEFIKKSHYTPADVNERIKLQILSNELQEQLKENVPTPSQSEIEDYYEAAKATQFTQKPTRDVRLITNKDRKKAEEAQQALRKDDSAKNWTKLAKKYSEDPNTKESGGLQKGLQEGVIEEPLGAAIFDTPEGQIEGPIQSQRGYTIFEVENSNPESVQELKAVESQIQSTLAQQAEQEYFANFATDFNTTWNARTFCAPDYVTERCANFKPASHSSTAPPACYEADPKGGLPEACPAPVFQLVPALPGSVTPLEPQGKPLAQRPVPMNEKGKGASETELPEGTVVPPPAEGAAPEEPPAEEAPPEEPPAESE